MLSELCYNKVSVDLLHDNPAFDPALEPLQLRADSHLQLGGIPADTATLLRSGWCSAWTAPESTGWAQVSAVKHENKDALG